MKRFIALLLGCFLVAFLLFATMYWLLHKDFYYALNLALSGATGGLAAEYLRIYLGKRKQAKLK